MGHDVIAIGQHRIDTSAIITVARQLAPVFNATIRYGYVDEWENADKDISASFDFIEQGQIKMAGDAIYTLNDFYYTDRIHEPAFDHFTVDYELAYEMGGAAYKIDILKNAFRRNANFDGRWWNFCRFFTGEIEDRSYLDAYRKEVYEEVKRMGGEFAVYVDDQGKSAWVDNDDQLEWNTTLTKLKTEFVDDFVNVSSFFMNNHSYLHDFPLAFYDDFKDIY